MSLQASVNVVNKVTIKITMIIRVVIRMGWVIIQKEVQREAQVQDSSWW